MSVQNTGLNKNAAYIVANAGKKTTAEIARDICLSPSTVSVYARNLGVSMVLKNKQALRERVDDAIRKYAGKKSARKIGEMLNVSDFMLRYRARIMGIDLTENSDSHEIIFNKVEMFDADACKNWLTGD